MVATINDILLVSLVFVFGYYTAKSGYKAADPIVKYRFIPRTASETLAMSDDTLSEFGKLMFDDEPPQPIPGTDGNKKIA
jgi:hypothetical protein